MSLVVVGGVLAGSLAAIVFCIKKASTPRKPLSEVLANSSVSNITTKAQLNVLFASGGKSVVYLTASW